ncbi:ciliary microtubule inner protein 2A isoform 1-T1 [Discoglossus pictus]
MSRESKSSILNPDPYFLPGYTGFVPKLQYKLGESYGSATRHLLAEPTTRSSQPILSQITKTDLQRTYEPPKPTSQIVIIPPPASELSPSELYPPGHAGAPPAPTPLWTRWRQHCDETEELDPQDTVLMVCRPLALEEVHVLQKQYGASIRKTTTDSREKSIGLSAEKETQTRLGPETILKSYNIEPLEYMRPALKSDTFLPVCIKPSTLDLPKPIQRKAILGYTGYIPYSIWKIGERYIPMVQHCMEEFDQMQIRIRFPLSVKERRTKPSYWPATRIYSPAGLVPHYTGYIPGYRHHFGASYGNTTRQLYWRSPRPEDHAQEHQGKPL